MQQFHEIFFSFFLLEFTKNIFFKGLYSPVFPIKRESSDFFYNYFVNFKNLFVVLKIWLFLFLSLVHVQNYTYGLTSEFNKHI